MLVVKLGSLNKSNGVCKGEHLGEVGSTEFGEFDPLVPENRDEEGV